MPNSAGVTVARINVKVSPDTKQFRRELKQQLEKIEKEAGGKTKLDLDDKDFNRKAKSANKTIDDLQKKAKSKGSIFDIDDTQHAKMLKRAKEIRDNLHPNDSKFHWDKLRTVISEMENAQVQKDGSGWLRKWKLDLDQIAETAKNKNFKIEPEVDKAKAEVEAVSLRARLKAIFSKKIKVDVEVDEKGSAGGKAAEKGLLSKVKNNFPSFGTGINPAGYAVILAGITAVAAPLMGIITASLMALPGLLTAVLAPIAAVALGMDGIKKAALDAGLTGQTVGKKGKVKTTLGEALQDLQKTVSDTFSNEDTGLVPAFRKAISVISGDGVKSGFKGIAQGLVDMTDGFANAVSSEAGMKKIDATLANIGKGLTNMKPGIEGFTDGLLTLVDQFAAKMPGIGEWLSKSGKGFADTMTKWANDGTLSNAFTQLGNVAKEVFSKIADWGKHAMEFMGKPGSMNGFIETLDKIGNAITKIIDLSSQLNQKWQGVVQFGRLGSALADLTTLGGMSLLKGQKWGSGFTSNISDFWNNTPWLGNATSDNLQKFNAAGVKAGASFNAGLDSSISTGMNAFNAAKAQAVAGANAYSSAKEGAVAVGGKIGATTGSAASSKMPVPDTSEAEAALQKYNATVEKTLADTRQKIEATTSNLQLKAPDLSQFKAAFDGVPESAQSAADRTAASFNGLSQQLGTSAQNAADAVRQPFAQLADNIQQVGYDIAAGLAAGIASGSSLAVNAAIELAANALAAAKHELDSHSPSKKFIKLGEDTSEGLAIGLENGIKPAMDQATELATKVSDAFNSGLDPTEALKGFSKQELNRMEKLIGVQDKDLSRRARVLNAQARLTKDPNMKEQLKAQAEAVKLQQEELAGKKDLLDVAGDYMGMNKDNGSDGEDPLVKAASRLMKSPGDFAAATGKQFLSDLGIGGNGMIGNAITEGIKYVFNIANVDDAMSLMNRQSSLSAMSTVGSR